MKERILGPSGRGRKRALLASLSVAALLGLLFAITSSAGPVGIASGFEDDDGNLADNPPLVTADPPGAIDWNNFDPVSWQPSPSTTPTREAEKLAFGWQFKGIEDWQVSTSD
ncbi:MAG TPA: hypothetical protein VF052_11430, partial [Solirubrobacterales bacterium]